MGLTCSQVVVCLDCWVWLFGSLMLMMRGGKMMVGGVGGWFICFLGGSIQECDFGGDQVCQMAYVGRLCDLGMSSSRGGRFVNRQGVLRDQGPGRGMMSGSRGSTFLCVCVWSRV
ncbi:hypothetical protein BDP81DRAFT_416258 [Colletotrichum phormii]|uniref:Uncharacterized protein n=1 Tax=Colletotrichum phormii TaxID=359342 RepID=A0AAJ0A1D0_9PEZI|nr:uncharacterized protein BDP81DRAFT_416258 [Colletotrichum phormii]KAK1654665.1 hypothetical protein BDP81DRAFT_416258 [Colletotrichum phormii]